MLVGCDRALLEYAAIRRKKCCKRTIFYEKLLVVRIGISRYLVAPAQHPERVAASQAVT